MTATMYHTSEINNTSSESVSIHPDPPKTPLPQLEDIPAEATWDPLSGSPGNTNGQHYKHSL